jgi:hypothetical protein
MSKFYTIRSADGKRSYGSVTKVTAKGMVRRGEATFVDNCSVIRLAPPKEEPFCDDESCGDAIQSNKKYNPTGKDFRGLSARPNASLTERYVHARQFGVDSLAVDAVEGWPH